MDFVLDASFALRWCFEDEITKAAESVLTQLQNQQDTAWLPGIWSYELLNGLGKAITRSRIQRREATRLWREIHELPVRVVNVPVNEELLELASRHNLAVYDAGYWSVTTTHGFFPSLPVTASCKPPPRG